MHFPKKTFFTLGALIAFLPFLGIPGAVKTYIYFILGMGVVGGTYWYTKPRKRKDPVRKQRTTINVTPPPDIAVPPITLLSADQEIRAIVPHSSVLPPSAHLFPRAQMLRLRPKPRPPRLSKTLDTHTLEKTKKTIRP